MGKYTRFCWVFLDADGNGQSGSFLEFAGNPLGGGLVAAVFFGRLCFSQIREVQVRFQIFSL